MEFLGRLEKYPIEDIANWNLKKKTYDMLKTKMQATQSKFEDRNGETTYQEDKGKQEELP